jgi:hypothetical protein
MNRARLVQLARNFNENGMKLMLEHRYNVRDLLRLTQTDLAGRLNFRRLTREPTTYVQRDYRHVESDLLFQAPYRRRSGQRVVIYILIEHQSRPDELMPLRLPDYVLQVYKTQLREWEQTHASHAGIRFHLVVPVVFYTGTRDWDSVGRLENLVELGQQFKRMIPGVDPEFVNLPTLPEAKLEAAGYFGSVLRLVQQRGAPLADFEDLLRRVVRHLETMPPQERLRRLDLLSYANALVYHARDRSEQPGLHGIIQASAGTDEQRREIAEMGQTMAEYLKEEGMKVGEVRALRQALLRQLRKRFPPLPEALVQTIETTEDVDQLNQWIDRVVTAKSLAAMRIGGTKRQ